MMGGMAFGFGLMLVIYWLFALAVPLACVVGLVWLWYRVFRRADGKQEARCSACNYSVRGAREFICAECGADLRVVGIKTPSRVKMPGVLLFLLLWTLLLPLPACTGAGLMILAGPTDSTHSSNATIAPKSGQYASVDINNSAFAFAGFGWFFGDAFSTDPVHLSLEDNHSNYGWLQVDPATMTYDASMHSLGSASTSPASGSVTVTTSSGRRAPFDRAAVLAWFDQTSSGDIDITAPEVIAEADELLTIVSQFDTTAPVTFTTNQFTVSHSFSHSQDWPVAWWIAVVGLFWLLVYLGGIALYAVIRRRRSKSLLPEPDPYGPARFAPPTA